MQALVSEAQTDMRSRILDTAGILLKQEGAAALSMRKLAKAVGASTIVLYTYFKNKQDIFEELYREGFNRLRRDLEAVPPGDAPLDYVLELGRAYYGSATRNASYYQIMFLQAVPDFTPSKDSIAESQSAFQVLIAAVQTCMDQGLVKVDDATKTAQMLWSALHGVIMLEVCGHFPAPGQGAAQLEFIMKTIRDGLTTGGNHDCR